jgi:uncharacterized protein HemY
LNRSLPGYVWRTSPPPSEGTMLWTIVVIVVVVLVVLFVLGKVRGGR